MPSSDIDVHRKKIEIAKFNDKNLALSSASSAVKKDCRNSEYHTL
jgi:hypothetical protein